jgi:hypothetical protein
MTEKLKRSWQTYAWEAILPDPVATRLPDRMWRAGSLQHLCGELFKMMTGIDMLHIPYRSDSPAITDLLAGQVQVYFGNLPASIEL